MAKDSSFDIVSEVDFSEVTNAVTLAQKEIKTRYDFKGSISSITLDKEEIVLVSDDEYKLEQLKDVLISKLIQRNVSIKNIEYGKLDGASGGNVRQRTKLIQGIDKDLARDIIAIIKNSGVKVKTQIQDDQIRVTGKNRDDLQAIILAVRQADMPIDIQFINYR